MISFLSFDVEALPARAKADHVDRLIWGKVGGGAYGIGRISQILKDYGVRGNFMLDVAMCELYSDQTFVGVAEFLLGEGHEVEAHLHSEWMARKWGFSEASRANLGMDFLDARFNDSLMQYVVHKFKTLLGRSPLVFRAGAYRFNPHTVAAASRHGFKMLTNFNNERHAAVWRPTGGAEHNEVFAWDDNLIELPVDCSPEPLSDDWVKYMGYFGRAKHRKKTLKTFNVVLHSWSLLVRENELMSRFSPDHALRLRQICQHLASETTPRTYREFLDSPAAGLQSGSLECGSCEPTTLAWVRRCPTCGGIFGPERQAEACPVCGGETIERYAAHAHA